MTRTFRAVVMGGSAGGVEALQRLLPRLPAGFALPILLAHHLHPDDGGALARTLDAATALAVSEARDKEALEPGHLYVAPAGYHLLVEPDETLALSVDERVHFSRPSIDVLFESAARVWTADLVGVLLSGANEDGARGLGLIQRLGGATLVEDRSTARFPVMPLAGLAAASHSEALEAGQLGDRLRGMGWKRAQFHRRPRELFGREYR